MKKNLIMGGAFLLPFLVNPFAVLQDSQLYPPKLFGIFLIGALALSFMLGRRLHFSVGFAHLVLAVVVFFTGFGPVQVYPYLYFLSILFISVWLIETGNIAAFFVAMIWGSVPVCLLAILQWVDMDPIFKYAEGVPHHPTGFFGQTTKLGAYTAILGSVAFALGHKWKFVLLAFVTGITGSSFAIGSLIVGVAISLRKYLGKGFIRWSVGLGVPAVIGGLIFFPYQNIFFAHGRYEIWAATWHAFLKNPCLGYGFGSFYEIFENNFQPKETLYLGAFGHAHNDYLQVLFEGGALGGLALLAVLSGLAVYFYVKWWKDCTDRADLVCAEAATAAILANAMGNFPFQLPPHNLMGIIAICVLLKETQGIKLTIWVPTRFSLLQNLRIRYVSLWGHLMTFLRLKPRS